MVVSSSQHLEGNVRRMGEQRPAWVPQQVQRQPELQSKALSEKDLKLLSNHSPYLWVHNKHVHLLESKQITKQRIYTSKSLQTVSSIATISTSLCSKILKTKMKEGHYLRVTLGVLEDPGSIPNIHNQFLDLMPSHLHRHQAYINYTWGTKPHAKLRCTNTHVHIAISKN